MQWSMRPRPVLAVLATTLAGLALASTTIAVTPGNPSSPATMPADGCPPSC